MTFVIYLVIKRVMQTLSYVHIKLNGYHIVQTGCLSFG